VYTTAENIIIIKGKYKLICQCSLRNVYCVDKNQKLRIPSSYISRQEWVWKTQADT